MKNRKLVFAVITFLTASSGALALVACSSSSATEVVPPATTDASTVDGSKPTTGNDAGPGTDSGTPGTDAGTACTTPPALFEPTDAGLYCPYAYGPDGGGAEHCTVGSQICCLSPSTDAGSSLCQASTGTPTCTTTGFQVWQCSSPQECAGNPNGTTCCLTAGPVEADPNCSGFQKTKGFDSTTCVQASACTGTATVGSFTDDLTIVCEAQADCPTGKTCTAIKTSGTAIGVCL